jgi:hypothetical protein
VTHVSAIKNLDASQYQRSDLHADHRQWVEKNCYVDIWIELLHALKLNPVAIMPFTLAVDFEGDQWTFFKPPHEDLRDLYGIDVQELTVWRPLLEHALEHVGAGKLISTEANAYWLPDTSGTDYRTQYTKSTIVINDVDVERQRMGYFHNASYYSLEGEDFIKTFRLDAAPDPTFMPLFAELVRIDRVIHHPESDLAKLSWRNLVRHFGRIPAQNPITKFRARFEQELPALHERGLAHYHAWAFASTRQLGAAFEMAAEYLRWLELHGYNGFAPAIAAFNDISSANKTFILKGARAVNAKRTMDMSATFDGMCAAWETGMQAVGKALG